jgi:hypothetical protein
MKWSATADATGRDAMVRARIAFAGIGALTVALVTTIAAVHASATGVMLFCGQHVSKSVTLGADMFCPSGPGLIVTADNVTLNLGGHVVRGSGVASGSGAAISDGVTLAGSSDKVQNGIVADWPGDGIYVGLAGSEIRVVGDTVSHVQVFASGTYGIFDSGDRTIITNSVIRGGSNAGIDDSRDVGGTYTSVHVLNNAGFGILLDHGGGMTLSGSVANANLAGIVDESAGATLSGDTADFNRGDGIDVQTDVVFDGGANTAKGNDFSSGATPIECIGVVCS